VKRFLFQKIVFRERPWLWKGLLVIVLLASFGLRMFNLTNPPLDFASTRQLFSVLKARGMYYHYLTNVPEETRQLAISLGDVGTVEPVVFETLVSQTYRITGEYTWIARIYSSLFWVLGGLALFLLIRQLASPSVAMIGTLFFLFLPYGVVASRAFMPDPLMVALIIYAIWALLRWQKSDKWKWAILFGLFSGAALFVKNVSAFFIMGGFLGVLLGSKGLKWSIRNPQVYLMVLLFYQWGFTRSMGC
jgi:chromate transport protein ChrA